MKRATKNLVLEQPRLLLCEGEDEVNFFQTWLPELGLSAVQVMAYEGKDRLPRFLQLMPNLPGFSKLRHIAVTRDADDDPRAAIASVRSALEAFEARYLLAPPAVFILPGGGRKGALETLYLETLREHPYRSCVEQFFACIASNGWKESNVWSKRDKALAQVWIATTDIPNDRFGTLVKHGRGTVERFQLWTKEKRVDLGHPAFNELKGFLLKAFPADAAGAL